MAGVSFYCSIEHLHACGYGPNFLDRRSSLKRISYSLLMLHYRTSYRNYYATRNLIPPQVADTHLAWTEANHSTPHFDTCYGRSNYIHAPGPRPG